MSVPLQDQARVSSSVHLRPGVELRHSVHESGTGVVTLGVVALDLFVPDPDTADALADELSQLALEMRAARHALKRVAS